MFSSGHFALAKVPNTTKTCPNLNGHFAARTFMVSVDFIVIQKACDWIHVEGSGKVLGLVYEEAVEASLDGVTREFRSKYLKDKERDFGSALFVGNILQGHVQRLIQNQNDGSLVQKNYAVSASMIDPNTLKFEKYNIDAYGNKSKFKTYIAHRIP